jgi:hypothetical protein
MGRASRYLEHMRAVVIVLGCASLAVMGCNGGEQSAGQPTIAGTQAALISYDEAMQEPVAIGDATKNCPERQLSGDQVVAEMDARLDEMYRECVIREARRGKVPNTVTIDIAILRDGSVQGATVSPGTLRFRSCIGDIVETVRFPKFTAPRMGARYQFHTS